MGRGAIAALLVAALPSLAGADVEVRPPEVKLGAMAVPAVPAPAAPGQRRLQVDVPYELALTLGAGLVWLATEVDKPQLAPRDCRWCDRGSDGVSTLNGLDSGVRNGLRWSSSGTPDTLSNVVGFAAVPIAALAGNLFASLHEHSASVQRQQEDAVLVFESAFLAIDLDQLGKFIAGRERPFVHVLSAEDKAKLPNTADSNLSFFSGHTTLAFALAAAGGTVSTLRHDRWAPWVWAVGMSLAAATGYLRIAADKHYFTDVLVGAVVGTAVGVGVPCLHLTSKVAVAAAPREGGGMVSLAARF